MSNTTSYHRRKEMAKSNLFVRCPKFKTECDIDTCPRFLSNIELNIDSDGNHTANGFCFERGTRYITDVPQKFFCDRQQTAAWEFMERDARDEVAQLDRIRLLLNENFFFILHEPEEGENIDEDAVPFDTMSDVIEHAIKDMDKGKMATPKVACTWQKVLPAMLSFRDEETVYYIVEDPKEHPEAFEHTLPNGETVLMSFSSIQHRLTPKVDRVREAIERYLERALHEARIRNSSSKDAWVKALGNYKRVKNAWTMPESQAILDEMVKDMIDGATRLSIDLSIPDPSNSTRNSETADAVAERLQPNFNEQKKSIASDAPRAESTSSKLKEALNALKAIVEDACANSKDGAFLFTRKDYVSIVNELWNNHTSDEYAVSQPDAPAIASLWREIRLKLIEYAKSMIPNPSSLIRDLSNENCWLLFTKFTTVGEKPHVLDTGTVKELFATLSIQEKPRKTIKPKRAQTPKTQKAKETTVDIEGLPVDYRFAVAKNYEIVVDCLHQKPDYECINPYIGLPPTARGIIKKLITSARKKKAEGWCKSEPNWRGAFQKDVAWRFKNQQIEVEKRDGGLYYWRIIPNELFNEHYICKLKPRTPSF